LIFPNLDSANIYKLLKELNKVDSLGQLCWEWENRFIYSVRRKCEEMVNMATIAVIDAQENKKKK
jgi:phosphotransacetylase